MNSTSVKCDCCNSEISKTPCELAAYSTVIDGKEHFFCCKKCAQDYNQKQAASK